MRRALIVGLFVGFVAGLVKAVIYVGVLWDLFSYVTYEPIDVQGALILYFLHIALWGIIYGSLYAFFYDFIPGIGIKKGFVYGLILWVTTVLQSALLTTLYGWYLWPFQDIIAGFFSLCLVYGPLIGVLYKKE